MMVALSRTADQVKAALDMADSSDASEAEKAEMLMEIAMGVQQRPGSPDDLHEAVSLYRKAMALVPADEVLLLARIRARMATALMAVPAEDTALVEQARDELALALEALVAGARDEEIAEAEMNFGLAIQNLAGAGRAQIKDAIAAYQRSLRVFDSERHPAEFAILQNNLATAFLSVPFVGDEGSKMREALAVQAFEKGLQTVNLVDHPNEYAMLQNNLGNALQYVSSSHRVENGFRALQAYDEALKVRTRRDKPVEYANTIANKANCLVNLPDDPDRAEAGNPANIAKAVELYTEAEEIFRQYGETAKMSAIAEAVTELDAGRSGGNAH